MEKIKPIKVNSKVKPIHFKLRKEPPLVIGNSYYVSFGMNQAIPCTLIEIKETKGDIKKVSVKFENISPSRYNGVNSLFSDELGLTPEEAVINSMTS